MSKHLILWCVKKWFITLRVSNVSPEHGAYLGVEGDSVHHNPLRPRPPTREALSREISIKSFVVSAQDWPERSPVMGPLQPQINSLKEYTEAAELAPPSYVQELDTVSRVNPSTRGIRLRSSTRSFRVYLLFDIWLKGLTI